MQKSDEINSWKAHTHTHTPFYRIVLSSQQQYSIVLKESKQLQCCWFSRSVSVVSSVRLCFPPKYAKDKNENLAGTSRKEFWVQEGGGCSSLGGRSLLWMWDERRLSGAAPGSYFILFIYLFSKSFDSEMRLCGSTHCGFLSFPPTPSL